MPSSTRPSVAQQAGDILSEVIQLIRTERESSQTVLTDDDCTDLLNAEERIRRELREIANSEANNGFLSWIWGSPQETKALQDAQALLARVKETIDQKSRERILQSLKSAPISGATSEDPAVSSGNTLASQTPPLNSTALLSVPTRPSPIVTSPLSGQSGKVNVPEPNTPLSAGSDYASAMTDAISTPIVTNDGGGDSSATCETPRQDSEKSTITPVTPQTTQFYTARSISQSLSSRGNHSNSSTPRTGSQTRRPAPAPPLPRQTSRQQQRTRLGGYVATNCVDVSNSTAEGITLNYGGSGNAGAVIHKTVLPHSPHAHPHVPQF